MSIALLDVNVLVALTWPNHVHHRDARIWFDREAGAGWASCPITQLGFVRVSSNPRAIPDAVAPPAAAAMMARLTRLPGHRFWPDAIDVVQGSGLESMLLVGHRQVTDAYLLALARHHEGHLVTLDRGIPNLIRDPAERARWVHLIPA